jgi:hypothetical protein
MRQGGRHTGRFWPAQLCSVFGHEVGMKSKPMSTIRCHEGDGSSARSSSISVGFRPDPLRCAIVSQVCPRTFPGPPFLPYCQRSLVRVVL